MGVFFFFKQKTAYEITTGDWSSDVCSSDLMANSMLYMLDQANHLTAFGLPLTASSGTPQSTRVATSFSSPLIVKLVDSANNPVANATVSWSVPSVGAKGALSGGTSLTNAQGLASVGATAT